MPRSKIDEAIEIIAALGYPRAQQNERSALSLLALVQLRENGAWSNLSSPLLGIRDILDFCRNDYGKPYAENSRESFRKETMHQFVAGGLALQNPDEPGRPPNSPKWCYQIAPDAKALLQTYGTGAWPIALASYLQRVATLAAQYAAARDLAMTPCIVPGGGELLLSPGDHSRLIRDIVQEFAPRFLPGARLLYVGDTGNKSIVFDEAGFAELGVSLHGRGKLPDVVFNDERRGWLVLVESVTSVGPMDGKRYAELTHLFAGAKAGLVFVTAFPDRALMSRFLGSLAWETEVWCASDPTHMIHFNGDRFLGPH
ncbi:MAG TPA: BsuBI/PstI family type II restriction endonuclease [Rhodocyclaceae bacterium]|nr:BsuBI/PstI family type II restriction endonuclease [Rhodocyclaceae bacterium]